MRSMRPGQRQQRDGSGWILGRLGMRDMVYVQRMTKPPNSAALSSLSNHHRTQWGAFFQSSPLLLVKKRCLYFPKRSAPFEKQMGRAHLLTQGEEDSGRLPRPPPARRRGSPQAPGCKGWCQVTTSPAQGHGTCAERSLPKLRLPGRIYMLKKVKRALTALVSNFYFSIGSLWEF